MSPFCLCLLLIVVNLIHCAPIDDGAETQVESTATEERSLADTPQTSTEKNPVQQWFESAAKNVSSSAQSTMNTLTDWFAKAAASSAIQQNTPTMYMGSFQLVKMPMPQMGDVIKGMGDLATFAQTFNKVSGGSLPIPQGIPLLSQG